MRYLSLVLVLLAAACATSDSRDGASRPGAPVAIDVTSMKRWTSDLSSNAYEGRAPGTPGEDKTVAYIAQQMEAVGLQPGNGGDWYQQVPLVETAFAKPPRISFGKGASFTNGDGLIVWTKRTEAAVALADAPVVFAGHGISAPERGWDDYARLDVRGKVVIVLVNDPDWRTPGLAGRFNGRAMTRYGRWDYKHDEAAARGAAAILVVHQTEPAGYPWAVVQNSWTGPQLDAARADGGASRPVYEGWLTEAAAETLLKPAGGLKLLANAAGQPGFKAIELPWRANSKAEVTTRRFTSRNVVGVLPGRFRPDETVIATAHWDHLGRCPPAKDGDDICNGALDNASGIAGLLALAKAHATAGPAARSLVFLAVTAEESGLHGSEFYAQNPVFPLATTVGGTNLDGLSLHGRTSDVVVIGSGKSELEDLAKPLIARQSRRVEPEPSPEKGFYYRSDHYSLAKRGVPMIYMEGGIDVRGKGRAFGQAAADDYTANRYHTPKDEYDPNWDWSGAAEDLALDYQLMRALANGRNWPAWYPNAEFRTAREASRAGQPPMSPESEAEQEARGKSERRGRSGLPTQSGGN